MTDQSEFDRGHAAGGIEERLDSHDRHFLAINGSLERIADELHEMALANQRLADQADARDATAIALAAALKEKAESDRATDDQRWSPVARGLAVGMAMIALVGLAVTVYLATRP